MSPLEFIVAFLPLGLYLGRTGMFSLSARPTVRSGVNDMLFLLMGLAGLFMVGPVKLLFPMEALYVWKGIAFIFIFSLYIFVSILIVGFFGPHIVLYNIRKEEFLELLCELGKADKTFTLGNSVLVQDINVQFTYDVQPFFRCIVLKPTDRLPNLVGWLQLEQVLRLRLAQVRIPLAPQNFIFSLFSCVLLVGVAWSILALWNT